MLEKAKKYDTSISVKTLSVISLGMMVMPIPLAIILKSYQDVPLIMGLIAGAGIGVFAILYRLVKQGNIKWSDRIE